MKPMKPAVMILGMVCALLLGACQGTARPLIPTALPTDPPTLTPSPTRTPGGNASPTPRPTFDPASGGPSPTPLLGPSPTSLALAVITPTRIFNPNAPRIEFFTSDPLSVEPGTTVTLFWSARNVDGAVIYRLNEVGDRTQVYNVPPDGNLPVRTRTTDRGQLAFVLVVGEGASASEQRLNIPLQCPYTWFFSPAPTDCPDGNPIETDLIDQSFERGRMIYVSNTNTIFVFFNDGAQPAWLAFESRYNPEIHAERDPNAPPDFIQPLRELGYLWRTNDTVRNRLGLGTAEAITFAGFVQVSPAEGRRENVFISGAGRTVIYAVPGGEVWQIIGG